MRVDGQNTKAKRMANQHFFQDYMWVEVEANLSLGVRGQTDG